MLTVQPEDLNSLFQALENRGYRVIGPTVRDEAIVLDTIHVSEDLPRGRADEQGPGQYRLSRRTDNAFFGHAVGPHAWKRYLYPPVQTLGHARREGKSRHSGEPGFALHSAGIEDEQKLAFFGVRPCDLAAIRRLDDVFLNGPYREPRYARLRREVFVIAVNCTAPANTCFCLSMNTGPSVSDGFDLVMTELVADDARVFLIDSGSKRGEELLQDVRTRPATSAQVTAGAAAIEEAARHMGRQLETAGLAELLRHNVDHPRWQQTAQRCLSCGNCTMVCPTCFCSTVEDTTDLTGITAERRRRWDSCFTLDYSYIHGGSVRQSVMSRYRQWIMHKLSTWVDQFGTFGCTGCGRCITWCPVGIDLTQEAAAIQHPSTDPSTPLRESNHG